ncbi:MAG TPA: glycoside hydrolase family 92 protein, partial [Dyella sp.]
EKTWLNHADLANGAELVFQMGPQPSRWGTMGDDARLPSLTQGDKPPASLVDLVDAVKSQVTVEGDDPAARAVSDNTSETEAVLKGAKPTVQVRFDTAQRVLMYTITSAAKEGQDPRSWTLEGSSDGVHWTTLDQRRDESFGWRRQTRVFGVTRPGDFTYYRWRIKQNAATHGVAVSEIEWLGYPPVSLPPL